jgi:biopolymer transport protein ExbD
MDTRKEFQERIFKIPRKARLMKTFPDITPLVDVVFLLIIFFMLSSSFVQPSGIKVSLPKAVTADVLQKGKFIIVVSAENLIYFNDKPISLKQLRKLISSNKKKIKSILIKADSMSSFGRIIEIWDICRDFRISQVNIATVKSKK